MTTMLGGNKSTADYTGLYTVSGKERSKGDLIREYLDSNKPEFKGSKLSPGMKETLVACVDANLVHLNGARSFIDNVFEKHNAKGYEWDVKNVATSNGDSITIQSLKDKNGEVAGRFVVEANDKATVFMGDGFENRVALKDTTAALAASMVERHAMDAVCKEYAPRLCHTITKEGAEKNGSPDIQKSVPKVPRVEMAF